MKSLLHLAALLAFAGLLMVGCAEKDDDPPTPPGNTTGSNHTSTAGNIMFYITKTFPCDDIVVTLVADNGGQSESGLKGDLVFQGTPQCNFVPGLTFANRFFGNYSYTAVCGAQTWSDEVVLSTECLLIELK